MNLEEEKVRNVMKRRKMKYIFSQKVNAWISTGDQTTTFKNEALNSFLTYRIRSFSHNTPESTAACGTQERRACSMTNEGRQNVTFFSCTAFGLTSRVALHTTPVRDRNPSGIWDTCYRKFEQASPPPKHGCLISHPEQHISNIPQPLATFLVRIASSITWHFLLRDATSMRFDILVTDCTLDQKVNSCGKWKPEGT
jgi:hypothetical protein